MRAYNLCCKSERPVGIYQSTISSQDYDSYYMCKECWKRYLQNMRMEGLPHFSLKRRDKREDKDK